MISFFVMAGQAGAVFITVGTLVVVSFVLAVWVFREFCD